jgi:hypothetical protein
MNLESYVTVDGPAEEIVVTGDDDEDDDDDEYVAGDDYDDDDLEEMPGFEIPSPEKGVMAHLIDIRLPLSSLRRALSKRLGLDLSDHDFWLQDQKRLDLGTTLVEQCVQSEGLVQINVEIHSRKIIIVDVLKPADNVIKAAERRKEQAARRYVN